jgi:hypothetical protein
MTEGSQPVPPLFGFGIPKLNLSESDEDDFKSDKHVGPSKPFVPNLALFAKEDSDDNHDTVPATHDSDIFMNEEEHSFKVTTIPKLQLSRELLKLPEVVEPPSFDENEYYLSLRNDRKLYYNKDIHIHILLLIFSLMLGPK